MYNKWLLNLNHCPADTDNIPDAHSLDLDEALSNLMPHQDPSCLTLKLHFHRCSATLKHFENLRQTRFIRRHYKGSLDGRPLTIVCLVSVSWMEYRHRQTVNMQIRGHLKETSYQHLHYLLQYVYFGDIVKCKGFT